jgi:hypothetical protein
MQGGNMTAYHDRLTAGHYAKKKPASTTHTRTVTTTVHIAGEQVAKSTRKRKAKRS